jgi:hypothetical protein
MPEHALEKPSNSQGQVPLFQYGEWPPTGAVAFIRNGGGEGLLGRRTPDGPPNAAQRGAQWRVSGRDLMSDQASERAARNVAIIGHHQLVADVPRVARASLRRLRGGGTAVPAF